jgi:predicted ribosomally synthesized peptide with nif11-like leader
MPIQNAINLFNAIDTDQALREQMYSFANGGELMAYLQTIGYGFSLDEFEDAVNSQHVQCQSLEAAQELLHKADWLRFQISTNS